MARASESPSIVLDQTASADLEMLGNGALSPLSGFMGEEDFRSVVEVMRLSNGLPWTIPIVLGTDRVAAEGLTEGKTVALREETGQVIGILDLTEIYPHDVRTHASAVFGTDEEFHPGVVRVLRLGDVLLAGQVTTLPVRSGQDFRAHCLSPPQVRAEFERRGWKTVVAFQTRNPIHRAHEYLMKCALESTDGLLLHPLVGHTKVDDLPAATRIKSYEVLLRKYFNPSRTMMSLFPAAMRYAGPREAVFHAIVRKNYGCTHFIVGRDHAGVMRPDGTPYYGPFEAQGIFDDFSEEEIGIRPFFYDHAFYCKRCEAIVTEKTAPLDPDSRFGLSGTKVRELLRSGLRPPPEITRPEVSDVLIEALRDEQREREVAQGKGI
jgi:sulfate adenylyltransferase